MVQVLPPVQSFGSKLSETLGDAAVGYFAAKKEQRIKQKDEDILEQLQDPNLTPLQRISLSGGLSKEKFSALSPILAAYTKAEGVANKQKATENFINSRSNPSQSQPQTPLMAALAPTQGGDQVGQSNPGMNQGVIPQGQPSFIPSQQDIDDAFLFNPDLARLWQQQRTAGLQQQQQEKKSTFEKEKFEQKKKMEESKHKLSLHQESSKYAEGLFEAAKKAKHQKTAVNNVRPQLKKHKTGALTWQNFFKKQFKGTFLENLPLSEEGAIIESQIPVFLEGSKELFGQRLSDADLGVMLGKTIDLGKSNAANEAILSFIEKSSDLIIKKHEIAQKVQEENGGYRPINFENQVEQRFQEKYGRDIDNAFRESFGAKSTDVQMKDSEGNDLWVPQEDVQMLIDKGLATPA